MPELSNLQKFINTNVNNSRGNCYSFVCGSYAGDAIIPENVCLRFIGSNNLSGIKSLGNNILNFDDCIFQPGVYTFTDSVVNINNCTINADMAFTSSKVYIANSKGIGKVSLDTNSYGKSHKNTYKASTSSTGFSVKGNSKIESYKDSFYNYQGPLFSLETNSFMKISDPTINSVGQLVSADNYSKFELYNLINFTSKTNSKFITATDNSTITIHNIPTLNLSADCITLTDSFCYLNLLGNINLTSSFVTATNSIVEIIGTNNTKPSTAILPNPFITNIITTGSSSLFTCTNSIINLYNVLTMLAQGSNCFDLTDTELVYINDVNSQTPVVVKSYGGSVIKSLSTGTKAKLYLNAIDTIYSTGDTFDINGSTLRVANVSNIESGSNIVTVNNANSGAVASNVVFSDITNFISNGSIALANKQSKLIFSNIDTMISTGNSFDTNYSSLYLQYISNIISSGIAVNAVYTTCTLSDIKSCVGVSGSVLINNGVYAEIKNCPSLIGDATIGLTLVDLTNVNITGKFNIFSSTGTLNKLTVSDAFNVTHSVLIDNNCTFSGDVNYTNAVVTNQLSTLQGAFNAASSVIQNNSSTLSEVTQAINAAIINNSSQIKNNINLSNNSSLLSLVSSVGGFTNIGSFSSIISGSSSGQIIMGDLTFSSLTSAFITDTTLGIGASDLIDMRTQTLQEQATMQYSLSIDDISTITADRVHVKIKSPDIETTTAS